MGRGVSLESPMAPSGLVRCKSVGPPLYLRVGMAHSDPSPAAVAVVGMIVVVEMVVVDDGGEDVVVGSSPGVFGSSLSRLL
jgi:hypothetical protein